MAWFLAALAGTVLLVSGVVGGEPALVAVALLAPVPFAALWGRGWPAGLIAGYAFWLVAFGSLPAYVAYQVYFAVEYLARLRTASPPAGCGGLVAAGAACGPYGWSAAWATRTATARTGASHRPPPACPGSGGRVAASG